MSLSAGGEILRQRVAELRRRKDVSLPYDLHMKNSSTFLSLHNRLGGGNCGKTHKFALRKIRNLFLPPFSVLATKLIYILFTLVLSRAFLIHPVASRCTAGPTTVLHFLK
jgi:hypothetical protein